MTEAEYNLNNYRKQAIRAAKDFHYDKRFIKQIEAAKSESEIVRIMKNARHDKFD